MKITKYSFSAMFFLAIVSCSSTGVLPKGDGLYTISASNPLTGSSGAKETVFKQADGYCKSINKNIKVISSQEGYEQWNLDFICK
ncbi:MAG: hypothetical protein OQK46_03595 [Gammaproteobacteria bacterium]|nr:hypothetical protein [Gammaproteobacteria bacterium]